MDKVVDVKHQGKENCEHEFIKSITPLNTWYRICKLCGRLEKAEIINDFIYYCNLFHGKDKVK